MTLTDLENHKREIADMRERIRFKNLALRLEQIPEFKELIMEMYLEKECARFTRVSIDPNMGEDGRAHALRMAQAAGCLRYWLSTIVQAGYAAEEKLPEYLQHEEELRTELLNERGSEE